MAFETNDDLDAMFDQEDFAVPGIFTGAALPCAISIDGIFDNGFASYETGEIAVAALDPNFSVPAYKAVNIANGDNVVINAINYKIVNLEPDGTGVIRIDLNRV